VTVAPEGLSRAATENGENERGATVLAPGAPDSAICPGEVPAANSVGAPAVGRRVTRWVALTPIGGAPLPASTSVVIRWTIACVGGITDASLAIRRAIADGDGASGASVAIRWTVASGDGVTGASVAIRWTIASGDGITGPMAAGTPRGPPTRRLSAGGAPIALTPPPTCQRIASARSSAIASRTCDIVSRATARATSCGAAEAGRGSGLELGAGAASTFTACRWSRATTGRPGAPCHPTLGTGEPPP